MSRMQLYDCLYMESGGKIKEKIAEVKVFSWNAELIADIFRSKCDTLNIDGKDWELARVYREDKWFGLRSTMRFHYRCGAQG